MRFSFARVIGTVLLASVPWVAVPAAEPPHAIAIDGHASGAVSSGAPAATLTFSHTTSGSNRVLFVHTLMATANTPVTATYNGVSMTALSSTIDNAGYHSEMFCLVAPATGAHNVVVTQSSGTNLILGASVSLTGANQDCALFDAGPSSSTSAGPSVSLTTGAGSFIIVGMGDGAGTHYANGNFTGWTIDDETVDPGGFGKLAIGDSGSLSSGSNTVSSPATSNWMIAVSIAPAGGGGGSPSFVPAIINAPVRGGGFRVRR